LKEINPYLSLEDSRIEIGTYLRPWKRRNEPRLAGISSFGFGGTNAHLVLSDAPPIVLEATEELERPRHILALSAKSKTALCELARQTSKSLEVSQHSVADICFSANTGRSHFEHRLAVHATSQEELKAGLDSFVSNTNNSAATGFKKPGAQSKIAFLFTGQGSQYPGMGSGLYETQPVFRATLGQCAEILDSILDRPLLDILFDEKNETIQQTTYTQPALFAFEYALGEMWRSWGLEPHAVLGHSVGEYVAACFAGVFSLEDGLRLIAERGRLMGALPENGSMAAVFSIATLVSEAIKPYQKSVSIAATNGPENTVISGERYAVQAALDKLAELEVPSKPLTVSHAFHSHLMDAILDDFESFARGIKFNSPRIPLSSNLLGCILEPDQIPDAAYWRDHIRSEVQFTKGIQALAALEINAFIEIGPSPVLLGMGRRCLPESEAMWLPSLRQGQDEWQIILDSLGKLYAQGAEINWAGFDRGYTRQKVTLPNYPFERQSYWIESSKKTKSNSENPLSSTLLQYTQESESLAHSNNGNARNQKSENLTQIVWGVKRYSILSQQNAEKHWKIFSNNKPPVSWEWNLLV